jgi:hypothetical protein
MALTDAQQAAVDTLDCVAIMRGAGLEPAAAPGVLWRGPDNASFVFYDSEQWTTMAPLLLNPDAVANVNTLLAQARRGAHVFCWAQQPSPWIHLPLIGRLFFADVVTWTVALENPPTPLRRSARRRCPAN